MWFLFSLFNSLLWDENIFSNFERLGHSWELLACIAGVLLMERGSGCPFIMKQNPLWYGPRHAIALQWRHAFNRCDGVSNHQRLNSLLNRLFRRRSKKTQSSASLASVSGIHRRQLNSPHKGPVTRKMFRFDGVIINWFCCNNDTTKHQLPENVFWCNRGWRLFAPPESNRSD